MKRPRSISAMAAAHQRRPDSRPHKPSPPTPAPASSSVHPPSLDPALASSNLNNPLPLSPLEDKLFNILLDVTRQPQVPPVTLRVAGGWVRDKILFPARDLGSDVDIDIALDSMLGNEFAEMIQTYLTDHGMEKGSIGLIQRNPDQSKHLETATMRILGISIDIVNLRTETYSHDSRIPDVKIGKPHEDALRRDLTINSLFYNINERTLEDFTGRGFDDIRGRIIRTPLPPLTTLLDDPLRALRAVRFAARLNFYMHDDLVHACKNEEVHEALSAKVSRERVSGELHRILCNKNAPHAIALLAEFGLFPMVIRMPPGSSLFVSHVLPADVPLQALSALINLHSLPNAVTDCISGCPARLELVRFAALLTPVATMFCKHREPGKRLKDISVAQFVLRVELRMSTGDVNTICQIMDAAMAFKNLVHKGENVLNRLETANAVCIAGPNWRSALEIALVMELPIVKPADSFAKVLDDWGGRVELGEEALVFVKTYQEFNKKVDNMGLDGVWDVRPVVNGNELFHLLPRLKKGPQVGIIMNDQREWMIENPGKGKDDVHDWIKTKYAEYVG